MMGAPHLEVPGAILLTIGVLLIIFRNKLSPLARVKPSMCGAIGLALIIGGIMMLFVT